MAARLQTAGPITIEWQGWTLQIPAGTPLALNTGAIVARPEWVQGSDTLRASAARKGSMFSHDATHRYVWVPLEACEPCPER